MLGGVPLCRSGPAFDGPAPFFSILFLLFTLSWCSACTSMSEGVFLMYPWREMYSMSTYSSTILFSSTPVFLPEKFYEQRNLWGCSPWGCKELGMAEQLNTHKWEPDMGLNGQRSLGIAWCERLSYGEVTLSTSGSRCLGPAYFFPVGIWVSVARYLALHDWAHGTCTCTRARAHTHTHTHTHENLKLRLYFIWNLPIVKCSKLH